jgi:hypothetical protein
MSGSEPSTLLRFGDFAGKAGNASSTGKFCRMRLATVLSWSSKQASQCVGGAELATLLAAVAE